MRLRFPAPLLFAVAFLIGGGSLFAQEAEPPALLVTPAGYYFVVLDDGGEPVLVKVTNVVNVCGAPPLPGPGPGPNPPQPPPPTNVETQVREWAREVNHPTGAQVLGLVYLTIADQLKAGNLPYDKAAEAIKGGSDQALKLVNAVEQWAGWRTKVGNLLTAEMQAGRVRDAATMEAFLRACGNALNSSASAAPAMDPELLRLIVQIVIQFILQLIGGGGGGTPFPAPGPL